MPSRLQDPPRRTPEPAEGTPHAPPGRAAVTAPSSARGASGPLDGEERWDRGDQIRIRAICGEARLDFTDAGLVPESVSAVFSAHHREGGWDPADELQVRAICGAVKLDFTRAELPPGCQVELDVRAIFGEVEITVPDGAQVELDGTPVFGSIEQRLRDRPSSAEPPLFVVDGRAIFGSIKVRSA